MMFKYFSAFRKEWLVLVRDMAGLVVLFIMPMILVVILAVVQEFGWKDISKDPKVPVLLVDYDHDSLAVKIERGLNSSSFFQVVKTIDDSPVQTESARELVRKGKYQMAIVIPEGSTKKVYKKIQFMIMKLMSGVKMGAMNPFSDIQYNDSVNIQLFLDPAIKPSFKNAVVSSMKEYSMKVESEMIFQAFDGELSKIFPYFRMPVLDYSESVRFTETFPSGRNQDVMPNTTQHNVPAWTIFAMFFIVIPLTSSIIKEREEGSLVRLLTMPVSYFTVFMAKIGVYLVVCMIQFVLMVLAGMLLLPLFGIPALEIHGKVLELTLMALTTSLAALGFGILVGTIARTHQQAAAFGAVSVVILAALGGLWVPTYLMPETMRYVATLSPLNWAHTGFYAIYLRGGKIAEVLPEIGKLMVFFLVTIAIAAFYRKWKPAIST
jgi:ABC-2 type transport system permease protein